MGRKVVMATFFKNQQKNVDEPKKEGGKKGVNPISKKTSFWGSRSNNGIQTNSIHAIAVQSTTNLYIQPYLTNRLSKT